MRSVLHHAWRHSCALARRIVTSLKTQVEAAITGWVGEAEAEAMRRELRRRMGTMDDARKRKP